MPYINAFIEVILKQIDRAPRLKVVTLKLLIVRGYSIEKKNGSSFSV